MHRCVGCGDVIGQHPHVMPGTGGRTVDFLCPACCVSCKRKAATPCTSSV